MGAIDFNFDPVLAGLLVEKEVHNKPLYRPNTYLHKWWARRCGSTFRLLLKALVEDEAGRDYYTPGGLDGQIILDPMMGGGTTLHEAIRMGANVIGVDVDPIPVLQARAALTDFPLTEMQPHFDHFVQKLRGDLAPWWMTTCPHCEQPGEIRRTLYGVRQACACQEVIKVDSFVVRYQRDGRQLILCAQCGQVHHSDDTCPPEKAPFPLPLVDRSFTTCQDCGETLNEKGRAFYTRYEPVAIIGDCPEHGRFYRRPSPDDLALIRRANERRSELTLTHKRDWFQVQPGPKSRDLLGRGIGNYLDTLSSRQLLYLDSAARHIQEMPDSARIIVALLVSTSLDFNSLLCGYKGDKGAGAVRHVFSRHGYTFPYTALENNPVLNDSRASGTLPALYHRRVIQAKIWANEPTELTPNGSDGRVPVPGEKDSGQELFKYQNLLHGQRRFMLLQQSAARLPLPDNSVDHIVTDPPYLDSVQYSDLAAFFHGFLRLLVPGAARWGSDSQEQTAVSQDWQEFAAVMGQIFSECGRVLKPGGRLIFTYHHWRPEAWAAMTVALKGAGFRLVKHYVVQSESPLNCHINGMRALLHDVVLVLSQEDTGRARRPILKINKKDSQAFCDACGRALGWMLQKKTAGQPPSDILRLWEHLL